MKLGVALPIVDIGGEPATLKEFAQSAEEIGYHGIAAPDHVLGVNVASRPDWTQGRARSTDFYHDPFVLFGFLAGCTKIADFSTQVLIWRSAKQCSSRSRLPVSTSCQAAGFGSASGSVGTRWSLSGSTRIFTIAAAAPKSRSRS